jgi:hypothetical protein
MSLEHPMLVIVVPALGRFRASVPVQPTLRADHDATDLDHDTIVASELPLTIRPGAVTSAQGTAVCAGDAQTQQLESPPFLRFVEGVPAGEACDGRYTAPPA